MSAPLRTVVAGVSTAADDDPTLLAATRLASWTGATLHLVHTFDLPPVFTPMEVGYAAGEWAAYFADDQRPVLEAAVRRAAPGVSYVIHTGIGPPAPAILEAAREARADLLVVGAAHAGRLAGAFLGTTAQRVLRGAAVPVLVVRTPPRRPARRLLLTTDLSEVAAAIHVQALDTAAAIFGEPEAVRSLYVAAVPPLRPPLPEDAIHARTREALEGFLAGLPPAARAAEPLVRLGAPAQEIVAEAEHWKADLLVVGTHARGWAARLLLGSVAEAAVRDAPCNVLAIPPRAAAAAKAALDAAAEGHAPPGETGEEEVRVPAATPAEPVP